ncbi:MAG: tRNA (adenosine(37)-N6)-threonylcarbamoyltransferase complex dimerization subunit type 1 TsaB [Candidatus Margulisbacteria bacterium]|jgi:tRNA threonylcarbamoyl adenosine modification protein YeaZ|nr:tRNA (adenosine(37)-N6)-threonylcarbamoyltransferase complex dimerization subunit type 1 TsaB [Candidatus Margulisiibacteriota bacterium]
MIILGFNFATENSGLAVSMGAEPPVKGSQHEAPEGLPLSALPQTAEKIYHGQTIKAEFLPGYLDELLQENKLTLRDIDRLGIAIGPGAFTGLRLSLVTAKTIALALNIPLVPVSTLEALALQYQAEAAGRRIRVLMTACRGESATALFDGNLQRLEPDHVLKTADIPGVIAAEETLLVDNRPADARSICALAARAGHFLSRAEILKLTPVYSHESRVNYSAKPELRHLKIGLGRGG